MSRDVQLCPASFPNLPNLLVPDSDEAPCLKFFPRPVIGLPLSVGCIAAPRQVAIRAPRTLLDHWSVGRDVIVTCRRWNSALLAHRHTEDIKSHLHASRKLLVLGLLGYVGSVGGNSH